MKDTSGIEENRVYIYIREKNSDDDDNDDRGAFPHHHLIEE
jgi:hypothetical protein